MKLTERRLQLAAAVVGVLIVATAATLLVPRPGPMTGTLLIEATAAGGEQVAAGALDLHSSHGWLALGTVAATPVPAAPSIARLATADVPAGRYDSVRFAGAIVSAGITVTAGGVEPVLLAIRGAQPVAAYAGSEEFNLGLGELAGKLQPLPTFDLVDQAGHAVSSAALAGRPMVVAAFHTTCRDTCPIYTGLFLQLRRQLPGSVALLEVTTDPVTDTPARLQAYAESVPGLDWTLLTGSVEQLTAFWTPLGVQLSGVDSHTDFLGVVDEHGYLHATRSGVPDVGGTLPDALAARLSDEGRRELSTRGDGWGAAQVLDAVRSLGQAASLDTSGSGVAPAFALPTPAGGVVSLAELRGRPVVVNFWASYCAPCRREMPLLQRTADARGVALVLVDERDDRAAASAFLASLSPPVTAPVGLDPDGKVGDAYGVTYYPVTVFIRADGTVEGRYIGETDASVLAAHLDALT